MKVSFFTFAIVILAVALPVPAVPVIIELREVNGKTIQCMHSGLTSDLNDCGFRSDWYAYVFVGSVSAITSAAHEEKNVQIVPEEVFSGHPPTPLTVLTEQGACLPAFAVGDHWLFFLRKENGKPIVLDYYGNDSRPIAEVEDEIETFRHLKAIGDFGVLRGNVIQGTSSEGQPVPHANVVAHKLADNSQFVTTTDQNGHYEFQLLPPAKYKLTVDLIGSFRPDDAHIEVSRGACWDLTLLKYPHARLGGHVQHSDGSPAPEVGVLLTDENGESWETSKTDQRGDFVFDSVQAGRYVIGIDLPHAGDWQNTSGAGPPGSAPKASLYYPGVQNRDGALTVTLSEDEKRDDLDVIVPN